MLNRELVTVYWAVANAIRALDMPMELRTKLIANICANMKDTGLSFDPVKFNNASWPENEL